MYLKEDIIGASSRITYGLKGDKVNIIRKEIDMYFIENNNLRFFVKHEKLSEEKVEPTPKIVGENSKSVQRIHKRKR